VYSINKLPQYKIGKTVTTDHLNPGELLHMGFAFWNMLPRRGFTAVLKIVDVCSRFIWIFCTASKKPPINIRWWFNVNLRREHHTLAHIHIDEELALADSTAFDSFIRDEAQLNLETTRGYSSFLNGYTERPTRKLAKRSRCVLLNTGAPANDWCYVMEHATDIYRITLYSALKFFPHIAWYGGVSLNKDMHVWGCRVFVPVHDLKKTDDHWRKLLWIFQN
jgi:hypothetical protein